jgi:predicted RNA-binding protein YlxR (DUF448 family)
LEKGNFLGIIASKKYPIRMCISCRRRDFQKSLIRFQIKSGRVYPFSGKGRSSYLCLECSKDKKRLKQLSKRFSLDIESFEKLLKELNING